MKIQIEKCASGGELKIAQKTRSNATVESNLKNEIAKNAATRLKKEEKERLLQSKRNCMPASAPDWEIAKTLAPVISPHGFEIFNLGEKKYEVVRSILVTEKQKKALVLLGDLFKCSPTEILLLQQRKISRNGKKIVITNLRYTFNESFNTFLRIHCDGRYDKQFAAAWSIVLEGGVKDAVIAECELYFRIIVDMDNMQVMNNHKGEELENKQQPAFQPLPYHVEVTTHDLITAVDVARPTDRIAQITTYIHDGSQFVALPRDDAVWTRCPFVLLRYAVDNGRPRYAIYSVLAKHIESIAYGNDSKVTSIALARFMDACLFHNLAGFCRAYDGELIFEKAGDRESYLGPFQKFKELDRTVENSFTGISYYTLVSDYVTLVDRKYGADIDGHALAYVDLRWDKEPYFQGIAQYFGLLTGAYENKVYPIIFARSYLNSLVTEVGNDYICTVLHELAHWLVGEDIRCGLIDHSESHGLRWSIYFDLLETVVNDEFVWSNYLLIDGVFDPARMSSLDITLHKAVSSCIEKTHVPALLGRQQVPISEIIERVRELTKECAIIVDELTTQNSLPA